MDSNEEYYYTNFMDSYMSDEDEYEDETSMMKSILEDAKRAKKHVLNF